MRLKPNHIYLALIAVLVSAGLTFAQESGSPVLESMEPEKSSNNGGEIIYTDGEGNGQRVQPSTVSPPATFIPNTPNTTREQSTNSKPVSGQTKPKSTQEKQSEGTETKPEESVLGFNFLYYIFQKYKMSDIID